MRFTDGGIKQKVPSLGGVVEEVEREKLGLYFNRKHTSVHLL